MSLTAISWLESARRKFFMNSTYIMSRKWNQTFLGSGGRNESNSHQLARIGEKKFFMNSTYIMSRKWETNVTAIRTLESARRKFFMNTT